MRWTLTRVLSRAVRLALSNHRTHQIRYRSTSTIPPRLIPSNKPDDHEKLLQNDFANLRANYTPPKNPVVLAHGLLGFSELHLNRHLPGIQYWRGITDAFAARQIPYITTTVPTTGSIRERAEALHQEICTKASGKDVNIVAHSMGGLDARYLISRIRPREFKVLSLTTIATPHRGSSAADMVLREIGPDYLPRLYSVLTRMGVSTGAFSQLTRQYVENEFNPATQDVDGVRYFSYGASATPHLFSVFRLSHDLVAELEGENDGLVSVRSSQWPEVVQRPGDGYKGTLVGVTHLDLINWTNRIKRVAARLGVVKPDFNAVALYLHVADMLAKEDL